jgi:fucose 4-O-acetylase-like acetyltransferase
LYVLPFVAILALFWACKPLPHIPLFCYYGRYSLIILGTHPLILQPVRFLLLRQGMESGVELTLIVFVVTMLVELPLIWLLKTWAPRFTAQEPFFKPGWKLR